MNRRGRALVHLSLGLGMLAVVVAAGLTPNTGVVQATSNCTYGQCPSTSSPFPLWAVGASVAAVVVALLLAFLILRRRRRPGQPPSEWEGPQGAGAPPSGAGGPGGPGLYGAAAVGGAAAAGAEPEWQEGPTSGEPMAGTEPDFMESPPPPPPAPVAAPPPAPMPPPVAPPVAPSPVAAAPKAPAPPAEEAEPDIDSLMAELEKISGEILKQKPKKKNGSPAPSDDDESP